MKLICDANEVFSAIIAKGKDLQTKKIDILFSDKVKLFAPTLLFRELEKNSQKIKEISGFSDIDFDVFVGILKLRIISISLDDFSDKLEEAKSICSHLKDVPYFAVALKLDCPIWSGEKKLKKQSKIRVFNTKELVANFGL
ncbi:MAG: PIN domain-containing protein [Nanoarchaeota archaeon]